MPYDPVRDTCTCDVCGYESETYDEAQSVFPCNKEHENVWECAECGKMICSACFKRESSETALEWMLRHNAYYFNNSDVKFLFTGKVLCPDCYKKAMKKVLHDITLKMTDLPDHRHPVVPKDGGPYSLYCQVCHCWVPNTANAEMRKEGCYSHSHSCGYVGDEEVKVYDDARLNRKIQSHMTARHSCCAYCVYRKEIYPSGHKECENCNNNRTEPYFTYIPVWKEKKRTQKDA